MMPQMVKLVMVEDKQLSLTGECPHLNVDTCNALTTQACIQCTDCGEHGIYPGKGAKWKKIW